jgi:hypothetical protein
MMKRPQFNRHWIGLPALALAVAGLGFLGASTFERPVGVLPENARARVEAPPSDNADFLSQLKQIPKNAFGFAGPALDRSPGSPTGASDASEGRDWTAEEWRLASAAVAAARKGGKKALDPAASANLVWSPPEEIANRKPASDR